MRAGAPARADQHLHMAPHAEKAVRKKTEKLNQCIRELDKELSEVDRSHKKAKKEQRDRAEAAKVEFLRQAAALKKRVDETAAELQQQKEAIARDQPELGEMKGRLADLLAQQRERREIQEGEKAARMQAMLEEIDRLEAERE